MERQMPKGYTWAKFVKCWTGDPARARFFEEKQDDVGNTFPAAYFTTLITYDSDQGFTERDIKFQGNDAIWACLELQEASQIALVNCEGHVFTKTFESDGQIFVRSTVAIKQGTVIVHQFESQSPPHAAPALNTPSSPSAGPSELGLTEFQDTAPF
jgi:hypothetical protein